MAKGVEALSTPGHDLGYAFFDPKDLSTLQTAIDQLDGYISSEGPFDVVMGFSAGAVLAATYILQKQQQRSASAVPFSCAVFLCSADSAEETRYLGLLDDGAAGGGLIHIPTAHSWGLHDNVAPHAGEGLSRLCDPEARLTHTHGGGHELPRAEQIVDFAQIIRRTMRSARRRICTQPC
ncbi:hypothetical protein Daus18300_014466 [Diaporthe australafricana]|uniref:Serine hydrolase domain-containing protein n=1 Tax=Diaporthe australafricana TaxID=127596 RepID=A0ABR3VV57_9PEZI